MAEVEERGAVISNCYKYLLSGTHLALGKRSVADMGAAAVANGYWFQLESIGTVSVSERRCANAVFTNKGTDTGEGNVKPRDIRKLRREQAHLDLAGSARFNGEGEREHGRAGWVRIEIEVDE